MPITIIVGGQFGSEGKGKVAAFLSSEIQHAVRTGGPNSGHTVVQPDRHIVLRHLPCAVVQPHVALYMGAGSMIDPDILLREIEENEVASSRLTIDPQAAVVMPEHRLEEVHLVNRIGSTGKGVGAAFAAKVMRQENVVLARDVARFSPYLGNVAARLHDALARNQTVLLEGTQGTGLSLHHGTFPFVTSRDTTAGSLCGEAGVGPAEVDRVVLVVRAYPIRVAGPSGPLGTELTWDEITRRSGSQIRLREYTTVTGRLRRVGEFDLAAVARAAQLNGATEIALTFADYIDASVRGATSREALTDPVESFISDLESATQVPVTIVGTGPGTTETIFTQRRNPQ